MTRATLLEEIEATAFTDAGADLLQHLVQRRLDEECMAAVLVAAALMLARRDTRAAAADLSDAELRRRGAEFTELLLEAHRRFPSQIRPPASTRPTLRVVGGTALALKGA